MRLEPFRVALAAEFSEQCCRALDVAEKEGHGPLWLIGHRRELGAYDKEGFPTGRASVHER